MRPTIVISSPVDTYSGYGARSRDFIKAIIDLDLYDVKLLSQRWGNTRFGYLNDHNLDELSALFVPNLTTKPDIWVQITVPNEFQAVGNYNIGVTAGIETNLCDQSWIRGVNNMDLTLTSSKHSKTVFEQTKWEIKDNKTNRTEKLELTKPVEVLFEGVDVSKYFTTKSNIDLSTIKESFCYLVVGHWLQGGLGHDRKNIGYTIKSFLETFKNKTNPPALILKTSHATTSIIDKEQLLRKIDSIKASVRGKLPNVYIVHGDMTDGEVNELYNHPKVKAMVTHTRGEGFGRPLLEFTQSKKPVIAPNWSGHIDFLDAEFASLIPGELKQVDASAVQEGLIIKESKWFSPDTKFTQLLLKDYFNSYKGYEVKGKQLGFRCKSNFSFEKMSEELIGIVDKNAPKKVEIKLPNIKKISLPKKS